MAVAVDLGRLEFLEIGVGAVDADVVGVEQAEAEHEVGDLFLRRHVHAHLDRFAALEHVTGFAVRARDRDVGDLDLARAPAAFVGLESVLRALRFFGGRALAGFRRGWSRPSELPVSCASVDFLRRRGDAHGFGLGELVLFLSSTSMT